MNHKVTINIKVTDQDIDDIMCSALEGGITYWCSQVTVVGDYLGGYASDQISRGGKLIIVDEDGTSHILTRKKFMKGLKMHGKRDIEDFDSADADCVIQYALFDELVFG